MKSWSTMLYSAPTSSDRMHGSENLRISAPTGCSARKELTGIRSCLPPIFPPKGKKRHTPRVCLQTSEADTYHARIPFRIRMLCIRVSCLQARFEILRELLYQPAPEKSKPPHTRPGRIKRGRRCCTARCDPCFSYFSACRFFRRFSRAFLRLAFHFCQSRACFSFARV